LDRRLGGTQNRSGHGNEEKNSQPLQGDEALYDHKKHCYTDKILRSKQVIYWPKFVDRRIRKFGIDYKL
jgi:hypothetical protein